MKAAGLNDPAKLQTASIFRLVKQNDIDTMHQKLCGLLGRGVGEFFVESDSAVAKVLSVSLIPDLQGQPTKFLVKLINAG